MSEYLTRKRSINSDIDCDQPPLKAPKRGRSRSLCSTTSIPPRTPSPFPSPCPPPSAYDIDRLHYHINLQCFSNELQRAANAIFPSDPSNLSRYSRFDVILLSWEEEDPNLPVSIEIQELADIFRSLYGYDVQEWLIPGEDSHNRLQSRILQFLDDSDPSHLKIVYYAGHGKLTNHGQPAWTSRRNSRKDRCPTVKWSGIQNTLEESQSDVLILLDCCSSGVCTTDEGNGVTELIAACAYNAIANGVGPFSFTHALNTRLRLMAHLPSFTVGYLYNAIFTEIQGWRFEDPSNRKVPVHLVLSQNHDRSIRLANFSKEKGKKRPTTNESSFSLPMGDNSHIESLQCPLIIETPEPSSLEVESASPFSQRPSPSSSGTSLSDLPEYPRLLFSIRLSEDVKPQELSSELFADWLRSFPACANFVKVEGGFVSDSTLLILSMPPGMLAFLPLNPAITLLGAVRSRNIMMQPERSLVETMECAPFPSVRCWLSSNFSHNTLLCAKISTGSQKSTIDYSLAEELGLLDFLPKDSAVHDHIELRVYLPEATISQRGSRSDGISTKPPSITVNFEIRHLTKPANSKSQEIVRVFLGWETLSEYRMDIVFSENLLTLHSDNQDVLSLPFVLPGEANMGSQSQELQQPITAESPFIRTRRELSSPSNKDNMSPNTHAAQQFASGFDKSQNAFPGIYLEHHPTYVRDYKQPKHGAFQPSVSKGKPQAELGIHRDIRIHSRPNKWTGLVATLDTGTEENWINRKLVDRLDLDVEDGVTVKYVTFDGRASSSSEFVQPTWVLDSQGKSHVNIFRVAPEEAPFDVIFGRNLIASEDVEFFDNSVGACRESSFQEPTDPQGPLFSPKSFGSHSSTPSTPGAHTDDAETRPTYSLPLDSGNQIVLAKMKRAQLALNGPVFGGDIPEEIGYEIYKLGTLVQALNSQRPGTEPEYW